MAGLDRLQTADADLWTLVEHAAPAQQRAAAAAAAILAAERTALTGDLVREAVDALREGRRDPALRERLTVLADEIDDEGFDLHDRVDEGQARYQEYQVVFRRARAASALALAMNDDPREAGVEGIYEAYHATGSDDAALRAVLDPILIPSPPAT